MLSRNAILYTLKHLFSIAFPMGNGIDFSFEINDGRLCVTLPNNCHIETVMMSDEEYEQFISGKAVPTPLRSADGKLDIPVFQPLGAKGMILDSFLQTTCLTVPYDLVSPSFAMLSRDEEYRGLPRDTHNRFLYSYSTACRYEHIELPLVDEYAMLLRKWVFEYLKPDFDIQPRSSRFIPTHDIDLLYRFNSLPQAFKSIFGRDLLINRSLSDVRKSLQEYRNWRADTSQDPYILAIDELISVARVHDLSPIFFFKAQLPGEEDCTYSIADENILHCIEHIQSEGFGIGLHGSYRSYNQPNLFLVEKKRLEKRCQGSISSCRQHYLRFCLERRLDYAPTDAIGIPRKADMDDVNNHNTMQVWQTANIQHDYTLGYAERPGFRCGTCHPYPLYDLDNDQPTNIIEHPLIVMDGSLLDYLHLNNAESLQLIERLLERCRAVEGDFIILWHNHLLSRNYRTAFEEIYLKSIQSFPSR